ncbi:UPF0481 protein At3g47200-like [Pyrus communis]|uniref:UPF0481 protein At3g47200-like n=1 Tax=Pyrus communis TaxID=23211 RepID=UPI0035C13C34
MGDHAITVVDSSSSSSEEEDEVMNYEETVEAMRSRLDEHSNEIRTGSRSPSSVCIYKVPASLAEICPKAIEPEMISIGPYHRGKDGLMELESYKWRFLASILSRESYKRGRDLLVEYYKAMRKLEERTRSCYSELMTMSSPDFVQMMVLDGCFIIELFRQRSTDEEDTILKRPFFIQILTRDLLKLQNQLPFFVLGKLFEISDFGTQHSLSLLALEFFNHSLPRPSEVLKRKSELTGANHLLDLFRLSFLPLAPHDPLRNNPPPSKSIFQRKVDALLRRCLPILLCLCTLATVILVDDDRHSNLKYRPTAKSIQCTTQLRLSWVKFRPRKNAESFLDVSYQKRVLRIPPITINELTIAIFINCMAFELCHPHTAPLFTAYIAFMRCLINSNRDVQVLCAEGIIAGFSQSDHNLTELFTNLGEKVVLDIGDCYLSKQFRDVEAYYSSCRGTFLRSCFGEPWSLASFVCALILFAFPMYSQFW